MQKPDLIKLAPTLSGEERYKLLISDIQREYLGEKPLISESERKAILEFKDNKVWEEYTYHMLMYSWAAMLWAKDIETEKLRVYSCYLLLSQRGWRVFMEAEDKATEEEREKSCEGLKRYVDMFNEHSGEFYAYQEIIPRMEQELYGVPLFDGKKRATIQGYYKIMDDMIEDYNHMVRACSEFPEAKEYLTPIVGDIESYILKKPVPDEADIEGAIEDIRKIAESETEARR